MLDEAYEKGASSFSRARAVVAEEAARARGFFLESTSKICRHVVCIHTRAHARREIRERAALRHIKVNLPGEHRRGYYIVIITI